MSLENALILLILITGGVLSIWFKKLTVTAALTGIGTGWAVYWGGSYAGIVMMATFFVLGTLATSWNNKQKQQLQMAEADGGRRKASQVLANAGVAAAAGLLAVGLPEYTTGFQLVMAASFASATADTLASELGTIYGKRFYNILTLRPNQRGLDGVVSLEGTLIGIAGSIIIAAIHCLYAGWGWFFTIVICGTVGNLADSVLGAALERRGLIKNDAVNLLNTLIAGFMAWVIWKFL